MNDLYWVAIAQKTQIARGWTVRDTKRLNASHPSAHSHLRSGGDRTRPLVLSLAPVDEAGRTTKDRDKEFVLT